MFKKRHLPVVENIIFEFVFSSVLLLKDGKKIREKEIFK